MFLTALGLAIVGRFAEYSAHKPSSIFSIRFFRPWAAGKWTLSSILNRKGRQEVAARAT
jgi:hypothetical protein